MSVQKPKEGRIKEIDISYEIVKARLLDLVLLLMDLFFCCLPDTLYCLEVLHTISKSKIPLKFKL